MRRYEMRDLPEARESGPVSRTVPVTEAYEAAIELRFGKAYHLKEVAGKLGISLRQVQALIDDGSLVAVNVGRGRVRRDLRVLEDDLAGFAHRRSTGALPVPPVAKPKLIERPTPLGANPPYSARLDARLRQREVR